MNDIIENTVGTPFGDMAVLFWAQGKSPLFAEARRAATNNDIMGLQRKLEEAEAEAAKLRAEIRVKEEQYAAIR